MQLGLFKYCELHIYKYLGSSPVIQIDHFILPYFTLSGMSIQERFAQEMMVHETILLLKRELDNIYIFSFLHPHLFHDSKCDVRRHLRAISNKLSPVDLASCHP